MSDTSPPLNSVIVRALLDKGYDKRRNAGYEIERLVKDYVDKGSDDQIRSIIKYLRSLIMAPNPHSRKGGLIGLASVALGLGYQGIGPFIKELVTPIFPTFNDQNPNVRYYATEALCNVCRVSRGAILDQFHEIFNVLIQLSMETDQNMKSATELLDRVMKDIIAESSAFDLVSFIPVLREKCVIPNPPHQAHLMIISWISCLHSVPDIDLVPSLPELLDGIFLILESPKKEVKKMTESVIGYFLTTMRKKPEGVKYTQMINVLIVNAQSEDPTVQRVALRMILTFIQLSKRTMLPFASGILCSVVSCLALEDPSQSETRSLAEKINNNLMELVTEEDDIKLIDSSLGGEAIFDSNLEDKVNIQKVMEVLQPMLRSPYVPCKTTILRWMYHLLENTPFRMQKYVDVYFDPLLETVFDESDEVVLSALQVLAQIAQISSSNLKENDLIFHLKPKNIIWTEIVVPERKKSVTDGGSIIIGPYFRRFLEGLLTFFEKEANVLKSSRGPYIIRQICVLLPSDEIYRTFAELLMDTKNLGFATLMVETLSYILLTSKELFSLRTALRNLENEESGDLFVKLFGCWCHSPVPTLTLCLLSHCYEQAATLVHIISSLDTSADTLLELDKLIQMIESPIFSDLRLRLLCPSENRALIEALYGILMLIPQTSSFDLLRSRLACVPPVHLEGPPRQSKQNRESTKIDFNELLIHFKTTQEKHQQFRREVLKERLKSNFQKSVKI